MWALKESWATREWSASFFIFLAACILIALGSLREVVGATGYWLLWAGVGFSGVINIVQRKCTIKRDKRLLLCCGAFVITLSGFALAAAVNAHGYTLYQGFKLLVIFFIFGVLYLNADKLSAQHLFDISRIVIVLGFTIFILCKYLLTEYYVSFGGRQGSQFAYPGVMWKTASFFSGIVLVKILYVPRKNLFDFAVLAMAAYLLLVDASRTGLLLEALVYASLLFSRFRLVALKALIIVMLVVAACYVLLLVNDGISNGLNGKYPFVLDRLLIVDKTRYRLLSAGLEHARECYLLGCGFGSAVAVKAGVSLVVHNAYLSAIGELGVVGSVGFTLLMLMPVIFLFGRLDARISDNALREGLGLAAAVGGLAYALSMMLHPMSSELSEWGIWIIMIAWQSAAYSSSDAEVTSFKGIR